MHRLSDHTPDAASRDVPPITSDVVGSFPWRVWHDRHPALLAQMREAHPFSATQIAGLNALLEETLIGPMTPLPAGAADKQAWDRWGQQYFGRSWLEVPFLWAESYFYRRLLEITGYFDDSPWSGLDPFAFLKSAELTTTHLKDDLTALEELSAVPLGDKTRLLLHSALWGNQADLGFQLGASSKAGDRGQSAHLVADDTAALEAASEAGASSMILVADNAGRELLADLVLIDHLLASGHARSVGLHLKPTPYYVSDATTADLAACLRTLAAASGEAAAVAGRLREAFASDQLQISAHAFYCAPLSFHHLPADLSAELHTADLVILKGDLNYRRLVGDCHWPATMPFADAASYFPAPVLALRTLKSDVVVGIDDASLARLDTEDANWRVNGRFALVQAKL